MISILAIIAVAVVAYFIYFYLYPTTAPQVTIQEVVKGDGQFVFNTQGAGDVMYANYIGKTSAGVVFDDAHSDGKAPYVFSFESPDLPPGWFVGLSGMQINGTRIINVPPGIVRSSAVAASVPSGVTLVYTVTLLNDIPTDDAGLVPPTP